MSDIFNNSIWPNGLQDATEGYPVFYPLGTNKVEIPDGITTMWPDGDKLIGDFVYKNDKVVGFIDTKALIASSSGSTTMNYSYIDINLPSIYEDELIVNAPNATFKKITWAVSTGSDESFDFVIIDFNTTDAETINTVRAAKRVVDNKLYDADDNLIGTWDSSKIEVSGIYSEEAMKLDGLFCNIDAMTMGPRGIILSEFYSDLSSLRDGHVMFMGCTNIESFSSNLSSLTNGFSMFSYCSNLTSFSSDLPSLTEGYSMFAECKFTTFSVNLSNLTDGTFMFSGCSNLTSFSSDLSSLTKGYYMFENCFNLTSFSSDLPSLTDGGYMFDGCKLDAPSVQNIIATINTYSDGLSLGMGCNDTTEDKNLFAQEAGYTNMTALLSALQVKGWTVYTQYNGRPTTTYGLRRPSENTLPVFVKLEEVEKHGNYTSEDGSKKYRLRWFHETTGSTEGYTQFNSLEEAIEHFNIKPIERN